MDIGKLRYRVTLKKPGTSRDDIGQVTTTLTEVATVWADIRFKNGKEFISSDRETASVEASCRIRKREVQNDWKVMFNGSLYEIIAILPQLNFIDLVIKQVS